MYQYPDYLMHYGVLGMKWGRRKSRVTVSKNSVNRSSEEQKQARRQKLKTAAKIGATVVGVSLAAYGGYKATKYLQSPAGKKAVAEGKKKVDEYYVKLGAKQRQIQVNAYNRKIDRQVVREHQRNAKFVAKERSKYDKQYRKAQARAEKGRKKIAKVFGEEYASTPRIVTRESMKQQKAINRANKHRR